MNTVNNYSPGEYLRSDLLRGNREDYRKYLNLHKMNVIFNVGFFVSAAFLAIVSAITGRELLIAVVPFVICGAYILFGNFIVDGRNVPKKIKDWNNLGKLKTLKGNALINHSDKAFTRLIKLFDKASRKGFNKSFYDIFIINTNPQSTYDSYGNSFWITLAIGKRLFFGMYKVQARTYLRIIRAYTYIAQKNPTLRDYYGF